MPSLADHAEDIPDIAATLLTQLVDANEVPLRTLTVGALNVMRNLDWPGNLPVLQNVVKTLALTALANDITGDDVNRVAREFNLGPREQATTEVGVSLDLPLRDAREQFEKQYFLHHIRREEGNMSRVADRVGLERTHLYRKLKQLGIRPSGKSEDVAGELARALEPPQAHGGEPRLHVVAAPASPARSCRRARAPAASPSQAITSPARGTTSSPANGLREAERRRVGDHRVGHADQALRRRPAASISRAALRRVDDAQARAGSATWSARRRARRCAPSAGRIRPAARSSGSPGRRSRRSRACACRSRGPVSLTMCSGTPTSKAKRMPLSSGPQIITGGLGSSIEWMSSR